MALNIILNPTPIAIKRSEINIFKSNVVTYYLNKWYLPITNSTIELDTPEKIIVDPVMVVTCTPIAATTTTSTTTMASAQL